MTIRTQSESVFTKNNRKNVERYRQFTLLLIIVTFAFLVLTLPACIYFVFFRRTALFETERDYRFMVQIFLNSIQFTSHGINFFLYCFTAKTFRHELREMCSEAFNKLKAMLRIGSTSSTLVQSKNVNALRENAAKLNHQYLMNLNHEQCQPFKGNVDI